MVGDAVSKEMVVGPNMPGPGSHFEGGGKLLAGGVVFMDHGRGKERRRTGSGRTLDGVEAGVVGAGVGLANNGSVFLQKDMFLNLGKDGTNADELTHGCAQADVFGFEGAESNQSLKGGLPKERCTSEGNDEASAGLDAVRVVGIFMAEGTCEIGIDITIDLQGSSGCNDHATSLGALEVLDNALDGGGVTGAGVMGETRGAVDGVGDVGTGILGKIHEHTYDGSVVPCFVKGGTGEIGDEGHGRGSGDGVAVLHVGGIENLVEKTGLSEFELLSGVGGFADAFDANTEEVLDGTFVFEGEFVAMFGLGNAERANFAFDGVDVGSAKNAIVYVDHAHQLSLHEEARILQRGNPTTFFEAGLEFFKESAGSLAQTVEGFVEFEDAVAAILGTKPARVFYVDVGIDFGLGEGIGVVNLTGFPSVGKC